MSRDVRNGRTISSAQGGRRVVPCVGSKRRIERTSYLVRSFTSISISSRDFSVTVTLIVCRHPRSAHRWSVDRFSDRLSIVGFVSKRSVSRSEWDEDGERTGRLSSNNNNNNNKARKESPRRVGESRVEWGPRASPFPRPRLTPFFLLQLLPSSDRLPACVYTR